MRHTNSSPLIAAAAAETASTSSSSTSLNALFTEKIFLNIQGLPSQDNAITDNRIVIGLFGNDAPHCVKQLQQLFTPLGLPRPCRPRATRTLQKEQLEANKVYKNCMQAESQGVVLQYSTVWRIVANEQIAIGAVTGKYLSREYPEWNDVNSLKHDVPGVVSVLRGSEGGFGFSIYPGDGCGGHAELDCDYIVVGRVLEGMDVVRRLNQVPVVTTARNINYMSLSGAAGTGKAPNRSCRYGGPMYCNEYKPLSKLTVSETGIL
ncbi:hypothetical protein MPSEU_000110700 [Mayamaea pseudoterrestris]|nr:hypothetical protein MPSEU_000110700 [Mayamaea pseudoterrestris]